MLIIQILSILFKSTNPFEREAEVMEAMENIKDTVITFEDKLRSTSEVSEAKIEEEVRD